MNAFNRLEQRLPDLMAELAPPRVPDYFDDILRVTARTRQRPAWTSPGRWLPVEQIDRPAPFGLASWRPLVLVFVIAGLLAVIGAAVGASGKRPLPPIFGLAKNGLVLYSTGGADILAVDPATGKTLTVVGGATDDFGPGVAPDGRSFMFVRKVDGADILYTANVDGSGIKEFAPGKDAGWNEWSPDSMRIVFIADGGGTPYVQNMATGKRIAVPVATPVNAAHWLADGRLLLVREGAFARTYSVVAMDGSAEKALPTAPDTCCGWGVFAAGSLLAYTTWGTAEDTHGLIHVLDVAKGADTLLASTVQTGYIFLDPIFSPDGAWLELRRYVAHAAEVQVVVVKADGSGEPIVLGPSQASNSDGPNVAFSPDGTQLLAVYGDGATWLFDIPSGTGTKVAWPGAVQPTWQRLAP